MTTTEDKARETVASWMIQNSFATGHGDTLEDLLKELEWQIAELRGKIRSARNEALEEAARVAEGFSETTGPVAVCMTAANRIRSLKREDQASDSPATTG